MKQRKIAVIGLGYVGLPAAVALGRVFPGTVGFDISASRVDALRQGHDATGEVDAEPLAAANLSLSADEASLAGADFFIVAVPTPIDDAKRPDLGALESATALVARHLKKGDIVVYESTVYPGVTEEVCGVILERESGLRSGVDFHLGYSPERINPGDREHTLERVVKLVGAQDSASLDIVASVYESICKAGVHRCTSIRVAEAAKVIENVQRDLNIALMNELALIFDRLGLDTLEVLEAAGTKWNFLPFRPGLVGGHCIGVDPYYLTSKAQEVGIAPRVILSGRGVNDGMGRFVATATVKHLAQRGVDMAKARVVILGLAFKENVGDLRNSRVPDVVHELAEYGIHALVHDPLVDPGEARQEYALELVPESGLGSPDAVVLAVPHRGLRDVARRLVGSDRVLIDVKSVFPVGGVPDGVLHWRL